VCRWAARHMPCERPPARRATQHLRAADAACVALHARRCMHGAGRSRAADRPRQADVAAAFLNAFSDAPWVAADTTELRHDDLFPVSLFHPLLPPPSPHLPHFDFSSRRAAVAACPPAAFPSPLWLFFSWGCCCGWCLDQARLHHSLGPSRKGPGPGTAPPQPGTKQEGSWTRHGSTTAWDQAGRVLDQARLHHSLGPSRKVPGPGKAPPQPATKQEGSWRRHSSTLALLLLPPSLAARQQWRAVPCCAEQASFPCSVRLRNSYQSAARLFLESCCRVGCAYSMHWAW